LISNPIYTQITTDLDKVVNVRDTQSVTGRSGPTRWHWLHRFPNLFTCANHR